MPDKRTDKSSYESSYGGGFISPNQYLAELACERNAALKGIQLGSKFWSHKPWTALFVREANHATKLLAKFPIAAILKAWKSPNAKKVRTFGASFFIEMVEIEARQLKLEADKLELAPLPETINTLEKPRPSRQRHAKSIREKLADAHGPTERGLFSKQSDDAEQE